MTCYMRLFSNTHILRRGLHSSVSFKGHWNKDWMPNQYPESEEERKRSAKNYNLHESEYTPYKDDHGYGDYPKLPYLGVATRDPFYPYDNPEHRRNFNETLHAEIDMLGEDRYDAGMPSRFSKGYMLWAFVSVFGFLFGSCYLSILYLPSYQPVTAKQYPLDGKTHYTFETRK
ncbi:hypothetical protein TKK_0015488 [Trichogramma kaykai]|uniref:NADH dehydrogenase [ubiquinone] 1 beta subcomplex subunit 8, mitochondrial n=1 Tax=Trichogramma kaykai TaxID=54128 RepID=A0ABD2WBF6_9HYME